VVLEQNGRTLASGVVLDGDGRVVTGLRLEGEGALKSPEVVIRYGDNTRMRGKIRHADAAYGLALVVPLEGKRTEGLRASEAEPLRVPLHVMDAAQSKAATLEPFVARYLLASALPGILTLSEPARTPAGTALIDESGAVAALTVRICGQAPAPATAFPAPSAPPSTPSGWGPVTCDIPAVAPVSVLRGFLGRTPVDAVAPPPWLGIVGQPAQAAGDAVRGVRVVAVAAKSPAAVAGLRGNGDPAKSDVIIAVDGQPVASPEELGEKIATHAVGDKVKLQVLSGKTIRDLVVQLRAVP
jgi:S1-C subfamily serine protease